MCEIDLTNPPGADLSCWTDWGKFYNLACRSSPRLTKGEFLGLFVKCDSCALINTHLTFHKHYCCIDASDAILSGDVKLNRLEGEEEQRKKTQRWNTQRKDARRNTGRSVRRTWTNGNANTTKGAMPQTQPLKCAKRERWLRRKRATERECVCGHQEEQRVRNGAQMRDLKLVICKDSAGYKYSKCVSTRSKYINGIVWNASEVR